MTDLRKNILKYSSIPSLSYKEEAFISVLKEDFSAFNNYNITNRKECLYVDRKAPMTIFSHIDRVPVGAYKPVIHKDGRVVGQLDNLISVAACYELAKSDANYNFLFTTHEESCDNYEQIFAYLKEFPDNKVFDLDIDIHISEELMEKGCITSTAFEKPDIVRYFNKNLLTSGMLLKHNPHWAICQIGIAERNSLAFGKSLHKNMNHRNLCLLGIPILNYHSNQEVCYMSSVENMLNLLTNYVKI